MVRFPNVGLTIGSIYAQIALGYTMVYGVLRLINFDTGELHHRDDHRQPPAAYSYACPFDRSWLPRATQPVVAMAAVLLVAVIAPTPV